MSGGVLGCVEKLENTKSNYGYSHFIAPWYIETEKHDFLNFEGNFDFVKPNMWVQKPWDQKKNWSKTLWDPNELGIKEILGKKNIWIQKTFEN